MSDVAQKFIDALAKDFHTKFEQAKMDAHIYGAGYLKISTDGVIENINPFKFEEIMIETVERMYRNA